MRELTEDELIKMHELRDEIDSRFKADKNYGLDLPINKAFLLFRGLNPQRYGLRAQSYFAVTLDYESIPSSLDCGDFKNKEGEPVEFKCSFLSKNSSDINVRQVRPWQMVRYYYVFTVDYNDYHNLVFKCYKLTKQEMLKECDLMKALPTHSTKARNEENEHVEIGFSIKVDSDNFVRWEDKYLLKNFDLKGLADYRMLRLSHDKNLQNMIQEQARRIAELEAKLNLKDNPSFDFNPLTFLCTSSKKTPDPYLWTALFDISCTLGAVLGNSSECNAILKLLKKEDVLALYEANLSQGHRGVKNAIKPLLKGDIKKNAIKKFDHFIKYFEL